MKSAQSRTHSVLGIAIVGAVATVTAACGAAAPTPSGSASAPTSNFTVLTPKPTGQADALVWAVYRETQTLDPIQAFDYPETPSIRCCATRCFDSPRTW